MRKIHYALLLTWLLLGCSTPMDPLDSCSDPLEQEHRWVLQDPEAYGINGQVCVASYGPVLPIPVVYLCLSWPPVEEELPSPFTEPDAYTRVVACKDSRWIDTPGLVYDVR